MDGPEWDTQTHRKLQTGWGIETMYISGGGGEGGHRQGFQRLWVTDGDGDLLQITGMGDTGGRRRLAGGGKELVL